MADGSKCYLVVEDEMSWDEAIDVRIHNCFCSYASSRNLVNDELSIFSEPI